MTKEACRNAVISTKVVKKLEACRNAVISTKVVKKLCFTTKNS
jgi:hypothetical protein